MSLLEVGLVVDLAAWEQEAFAAPPSWELQEVVQWAFASQVVAVQAE